MRAGGADRGTVGLTTTSPFPVAGRSAIVLVRVPTSRRGMLTAVGNHPKNSTTATSITIFSTRGRDPPSWEEREER